MEVTLDRISLSKHHESNTFIPQIVLLTVFFGTLSAIAVLTASLVMFANRADDLQSRLIVDRSGSV